MSFISPTLGPLTFSGMAQDIRQYVQAGPEAQYRLIVGTDSQLREHSATFVTAVVVHRQGKGARYYYQREERDHFHSLRQRIFYETSRSLGVAGWITEWLSSSGVGDLDIEVHIDIGPNGQTRDLIREIVGMVTGSGYTAKIKPDSYGASTVADRYTK